MRPAIYYPWVYLRGGAERVLVELMRRSRHHWTLYTNHFEPSATFPEFADLDVVVLQEVSIRRTIPSVARAAVTLLRQPLEVLRRHDALLVVSEGLGNLVAARSPVPTSCVCLTPLKVVHDPVTRDRFFGGRLRPHYRAALAAYQFLERPGWRRYRRILCISEEVRRRVISARLATADRLEVAYPGVDLGRYAPTGEREPFFLVPGRIMWQKNLDLALAAWRRFRPAPNKDFALVFAGAVDEKSKPYLGALRARAAGRSDVRFVVDPSDAELLRLYQRAHAVVAPAPNEDWGLVALEAMACGKVVLATDRGGPREIVIPDRTGLLRSNEPEEFAEGLAALATAPAAKLEWMSRAARSRAEEFPWSRFVARIDEHVGELGALGAEVPMPELASSVR